MNRFFLTIFTSILLLCSSMQLVAGEPTDTESPQARSLEQLLRLVEQGRARDAAEQQRRLREFRSQETRQAELLAQARQRRDALANDSAQLESRFQEQETRVTELQGRLNERLGSLREMFGILQQVSGDMRGVFQASVVSSQYPDREEFFDELIEKAGSSAKLPSIEEIERLWFEMQREATAAGRITSYTADVVNPDGMIEAQEVTRVGTFNVIANGKYLHFDAERSKLVELPRQPAGRYLSLVEDYLATGAAEAPLWIDPSRGSLLSLLIQTPDLSERIDQGGTIGYIIIALGFFALLLAGERFVSLALVDGKVRRQMKSNTPDKGNPLGRIMATYQKYCRTDKETLELRLGEAIVQETPKLTRFLPVLKIIAVVAPLLGLLGTVTGMINTFQAITLFGTGDPKLMAGGISQALVTTVLGLTVAIPAVLLHTLVAGRSKRLVQTLEERAVGIVAQHSEEQGDPRHAA